MPSKEEEESLTRWHTLLGTELAIALKELSKIHKDSANQRHQLYVKSCAEQYVTIIARVTAGMEKTSADWVPLDFNNRKSVTR